jgi:hypothetical protein
MTDPRNVKQLTNGVARDDGLLVKFDVITTAGETIALHVPTSNIGHVIGFLVGLANHAAKRRAPSAGPQKMSWEGAPIPVETVAIAPGKTEQEKVIVFHLGEMSLGFTLTSLGYAALLELARHVAGEAGDPGNKDRMN